MLSPVIEPKRNHDSDRDAKLLHGNETAAQIGRCQFTEIQGHHHGELTNGKTSDESAHKDHGDINRSGLNDGSDEEDDVGKQNRPPSGQSIGNWSVNEGTKHGTQREYGNHPSLERIVAGQERKLLCL